MWFLIFGFIIIAMGGCIAYLISRLCKFNFINKISGLEKMYSEHKILFENTGRSIVTIRQIIDKCNKEIESIADNIKKTEEQRDMAVLNAAVGRVHLKERKLQELAEKCTGLEEKISQKEEELDKKEKELLVKESTNDYVDYIYYRGERDKIKEYLDSINKEKNQVLQEIKEFAAEKKKRNEKKITLLENQLEEEKKNLNKDYDFEKELNVKIKDYEEKTAISAYIISECEKKLDETASVLTEKKSEYNMLLTNNIADDIKKFTDKKAELEDLHKEKLEGRNNNIIENEKLSALLTEYIKEREKLNKSLRENIDFREKFTDARSHLEKMMSIYSAEKDEELYDIIHNRIIENTININNLKEKYNHLNNLLNDIYQGRFAEENESLKQVYSYIIKYHGEIGITGNMYLKTLSDADRKLVLERVPVLPYSIIINKNFESIVGDIHLKNINLNGNFVPVIDEAILKKGRDINEGAVFVMSSNDIFSDDNMLNKHKSDIERLLEEVKSDITKRENANEVYNEDMHFLREYIANVKNKADNALLEYDDIKNSLKENESLINECEEKIHILSENIKAVSDEIESTESKMSETEITLSNLKEIFKISNEGNDLEDKHNKEKSEFAVNNKLLKDDLAKLDGVKNRIIKREHICQEIEKNIRNVKEQWNRIYAGYYEEIQIKDILLEDSELDAKLSGLIEAYESENSNIADKRKLLENYDIAMEKSLQAIDYKGVSVDALKMDYEKGVLSANENSTLISIKEDIREIKSEVKKQKEEYRVLCSKKDNTQGEINEANSKIKEKYGDFIYNISIPAAVYLEDYLEDMKKQEELCTKILIEEKNKINDLNAIKQQKTLMERDLDRIVKNGNIIIDESVLPFGSGENIDERIENIVLQYEKYTGQVYDKKTEFNKDKEKLAELLIKTGAAPLAEELRRNTDMPQNMGEADELRESIKDVIKCINLEKERVLKSLTEMEQIKDSFENQCIQSCISIKTQLDRLPNLSKITMEDQIVSIISLTIPYVKEEMYKERMSKYIDDIVKAADNILNRNDRIKYIKNQLAWKKLFSVIVTDMNGIRLNLYKRERIKEQSRYLPYEEAVGSTGQSQGIYIQFLIAIINYITNINSKETDNRGLRKVIFIDNPFGAAKDIYIWEPIFKLLKVNNVQLIVPARGATPAITGRFDVNYILGQKFNDGKQQTVVVDYSSNVDSDKLDYTKMDFKQVKLFQES